MQVTKTSIFTGITRTLEIDITEEQLSEIESKTGRLIQHIVPHLTPDEREFLLTGCAADEWNELFKEEED